MQTSWHEEGPTRNSIEDAAKDGLKLDSLSALVLTECKESGPDLEVNLLNLHRNVLSAALDASMGLPDVLGLLYDMHFENLFASERVYIAILKRVAAEVITLRLLFWASLCSPLQETTC